MICSSQNVMKCDEYQPLLERYFCLRDEERRSFKCWTSSKSPKSEKWKRKSSSTNHFTSSSSKLAISSHAETFVNQSFRWFNGVITFLIPEIVDERYKVATWKHHRQCPNSFNIRFQGWLWWRKNEKMENVSHFFIVSCFRVERKTIFRPTSVWKRFN